MDATTGDRVFKAFRYTCQFICLLGFGWLVYGTCKTYLNHATMTVTTSETYTELPLPVFWVCYDWPWTRQEKEDNHATRPKFLPPDQFKNATKDPTRLLFDIYVNPGVNSLIQ